MGGTALSVIWPKNHPLQEDRAEILRIATRYGAHNVRIFGSVARGDDHPGSDLDLLVETESGKSRPDLVGLGQDLGKLRQSAMTFFFKSCILSLFLGLTVVMLIYGTGIGTYNSTVCRQQYTYSVELYGFSCKLLGFPTSYVENDVWGHNAHVYPVEFLQNVVIWSTVGLAALWPLRRYLKSVFEAASATNTATRAAIIVQLLAVPLVFLILVNDLPVRLPDLHEIFLRALDNWTFLYLPLPIVTVIGVLLGVVGLRIGLRGGSGVEGSRGSGRLVLNLPFVLALWNIFAIVFVGWIPEVV
jgi:predicted nucleotidyltransferase